jgi:hypothetical protein
VANPELVKEFVLEKIVSDNWNSLFEVQADYMTQNYNYMDEHPNPGINLYRLKLIEKNNSFFYSPVRQISRERNDPFVIYPNPASQQVIVTGDFSSLIKIKLFDISGKLKLYKEVLSGNNSISIDLSSLLPGVYVLEIGEVIKKLVISK